MRLSAVSWREDRHHPPDVPAKRRSSARNARDAEDAGIDGVFSFDHLWPGAEKSRPALSMYPMLAAVAATTRQIRIGSLVARVGFLPDRLVVESFLSLQRLAGQRLVAALGIGDANSVSENEAYGVEWSRLEERRASLAAILGELTAQGIECWVGATAAATLEIARAAGVTVNLWDVDLVRVEAEVARGPANWAGPLPAELRLAATRLRNFPRRRGLVGDLGLAPFSRPGRRDPAPRTVARRLRAGFTTTQTRTRGDVLCTSDSGARSPNSPRARKSRRLRATGEGRHRLFAKTRRREGAGYRTLDRNG